MKILLACKFSLILGAAIILAGAANAAPVINSTGGTFNKGEQVSVSGSGFGSRGNFNSGGYRWNGHQHLAFRFKDFNDQSLTSGGFGLSASNPWILRSGGRVPGSFMATKFHDGQRLGALEANQDRTTGVVYSSFWIMMPAGTASESSKFWRIYEEGQNNLYLENYPDGGSWVIKGAGQCSDASCNMGAAVWTSPDKIRPNTWHRIETLVERDNRGRFSVWMDGKFQWSRDFWVSANFSGNGHSIDIGNLLGSASSNSPDSNSFNYDEAYFDFTQARVEVGNAPTWAGCTRREVQIPLAWSDSGVTIAVNQGSFATGSTAYLYVVGPDGSVNQNGYPIVFGGSSSPPSPPESVHVD